MHLQLFSKLRFTPKVSQIADLNWCSTHTRALLLTIFLARCSLRCVWVVHGRTIHLLQALPIHPDSKQALRELGDCPISASITHQQLITFPRRSLPPCGHCSGAITATHHHIHSPNEDCTVTLTHTWQVQSFSILTVRVSHSDKPLLHSPFRWKKMKMSLMLPVLLFSDDLLRHWKQWCQSNLWWHFIQFSSMSWKPVLGYDLYLKLPLK